MKLIDLIKEYFDKEKTSTTIYVDQVLYDLLSELNENSRSHLLGKSPIHGDLWSLTSDCKIITPFGDFEIKPINDRVVELKSEKGDMTKFILKRLRSEVENLIERVESLENSRILSKVNFDMKMPLSMGVLMRDDGYCEFCGRSPTEHEKDKFELQAMKLNEKRELEIKELEKEMKKNKAVWKLYLKGKG